MTDNNTDIKDTWIDVETLTKLKNITKRAVRLSLNQNKYEYKTENIRGGKTYNLIINWIDFRENYKKDKLKAKSKNIDKEFIELYNTGMLYQEIFIHLGKTSIGSLYRWRALLDYNKDWTALVGQYKYSTRKEYNTSLNEEQIKIFIQILLSQMLFQ